MLKTITTGSGTALIKKVKQYVPNISVGKKAIKLEEIETSSVTVSTGKEFDADEDSQNRMLKAIHVLGYKNLTETQWKLFNNTIALVTVDELNEALAMAGELQTQIWFAS